MLTSSCDSVIGFTPLTTSNLTRIGSFGRPRSASGYISPGCSRLPGSIFGTRATFASSIGLIDPVLLPSACFCRFRPPYVLELILSFPARLLLTLRLSDWNFTLGFFFFLPGDDDIGVGVRNGKAFLVQAVSAETLDVMIEAPFSGLLLPLFCIFNLLLH